MKLLMVEYNFPPKVGVGVIRTVKLAKYLPDHGWEPVILSVKASKRTAGFDFLDEAEIRKLTVYRAKELIQLDRITGRDVHLGWSFPALLAGLDIARKEDIDVIYASYPYAANMLPASLLKRMVKIPFLANYEDLWTNSFFSLPAIEFSVQRIMEEFVLRSADGVVVVTPSYVADIKRFFNFVSNISVVRNGFDPEDFESVVPVDFSKFTILHAGTASGTRIPRIVEFLLALRDFKDEKSFQVVFLGYVHHMIRDLIEKADLSRIVKLESIRSHKEAIRWILGADVLLLVPAAKFIVPLKTYEYLASGRFIFNVGYEQGETGQLISKFRAGISVIPKKKELRKAIKEIVRGNLLERWDGPDQTGIEELSWPKLAQKLAFILDSMVR